jgi:hypothetical protein
LSFNFPALPDPPRYVRGPAGWEIPNWALQHLTTTDTTNIISQETLMRTREILGMDQQDGDSMNNDYEVALNDGRTEYVENIRAVNVGAQFTAFQRAESGGLKTVIAYRTDAILSYRPLPPSEEIIRPKHTYSVLFENGGSKKVQADLFKVSNFGEDKVYEFFSKTSDGGAREELSVPFRSVVLVERVDADQDVAVNTADVPAQPVAEDMPELAQDAPDYEAVVRPKRKI